MDSQLRPNMVLQSPAGPIKIINFIASGGQGEVYRVELNQKEYALKWYFTQTGTPQLKKAIQTLISKRSPGDRFLWPKVMVESATNFGYVMDLRPTSYRSLQDWALRKYDMSIAKLAYACMQLTDSYHALHAKGLSYQDISLGNVFINPHSGDVLICDNDNVTTNGETIGSVLGTPMFLAPELVDGDIRFPNADTDRYSLAVLLFHILLIGHPFHGQLEANIRCLDLPAQRKLYGKEAVFVYHPSNQSNRPVRGIHNSVINLWNLYPENIRNLFIKTFTLGIKNPQARVRESEWRNVFAVFETMIFTCPSCKKSEMIYDSNQIKQYGKLKPCRKCGVVPNLPRIKLNDHIMVIEHNRPIYRMHIDSNHPTDRSVIARFEETNGSFYINNRSLNNITKSSQQGNANDILPGQKTLIQNGDQLHINGVIGYVRF
jgi:eukaryotic-like serine/threonine-protein kinase